MDLDALVAEGMKAHQSGDVETAFSLYAQVLQNDPDHADGLHYMGLLVFRDDQPEKAELLLQKSLSLNEENAVAHANLGMVYAKTKRKEEALQHYLRSVEIDPDQPDIWTKLGALLTSPDPLPDTLEILSSLVDQHRKTAETWCIYGIALWKAKHCEAAADALDKALVLGLRDTQTAVRSARLLYETGQHERSMFHLENLRMANPDDVGIGFLLASQRGDDLSQAPEDYVRKHFDSFAESFDTVLKRLGYDAPKSIAEEVRSMSEKAGRTFADAVDLGCGTGLCGPLIREFCDTLSGLDLSKGMLERAASRKCYDYLIEGEIVAFLNADLPTRFDLAVCADTLCYLGDLQPFFDGLSKTLKPGGGLVASVELFEEDPQSFRLHAGGRYAHGIEYLRTTAADAQLGFGSATVDVLRKEFGKEVMGLIFCAYKPLKT